MHACTVGEQPFSGPCASLRYSASQALGFLKHHDSKSELLIARHCVLNNA